MHYPREKLTIFRTQIHVQIIPNRKWNNFDINEYLMIKMKNHIEICLLFSFFFSFKIEHFQFRISNKYF
jgi:hypothetical protein